MSLKAFDRKNMTAWFSGGVHFGVVGVLVGHRNAGQLIKFPPFAILRCIRGKVERKVEVRGGEMHSL